MTEECREGDFREAVREIANLDVFYRMGSVFRVLETDFEDADLDADD